MADSFTSLLRFIQMVTGSDDTTWGDNASATFGIIEQAIAGSASISLTASDHTLTTANNASDEARNKVLTFTGTPGATRTVTVPNLSKLSMFINNTDSDVVFQTAAPSTSGLIKKGQTAFVFCDGANNVTAYMVPSLPGQSVLSQLHADMSF